MHPYVMYITGLVVVLCLCQMLLHHYKVIKTHLQPKRTRRSRFPPHVRLRGFGSADYQERGGYGGDAIVNGKLTHVKGTMTDWSWDAADRELPPPWAKGSLPLLFDRGNRSDAYFEEDMQAMKDCSATMNRFSVSWAKLQPNGSSSCLEPPRAFRPEAASPVEKSTQILSPAHARPDSWEALACQGLHELQGADRTRRIDS